MRVLTRLVVGPMVVLLVAGIAYAKFEGDWFRRHRVVRVEGAAEVMTILFVYRSSVHGEIRVVDDTDRANLATFRGTYTYPVSIEEGETVTLAIRVTPVREAGGNLTASCWFVDRGHVYNRKVGVGKPVECRYTTTG